MANRANIGAPLNLVKLTPLMEQTSGRPEVLIGLIDGPVLISRPELTRENIREVPGRVAGACTRVSSMACMHGTFVAGILSARRGSPAPAIAPNCTLLVRPIFGEEGNGNGVMPTATPEELASAIIETVDAGARVVNLSAALAQPSPRAQRELEAALDYASSRGAVIVAAAGNQGTVGGSAITRHPWVIPVVACDIQGAPLDVSNLGSAIGRHGLKAPGEGITSLGTNSGPQVIGGTSAAAPFVTGAIALLWSEFPAAPASEIKSAVTATNESRRATVVPPLLNAWAAYQVLSAVHARA